MDIEGATRIAALAVSVAIIAVFLVLVVVQSTINLYLGPLAAASLTYLTGWEVLKKKNGKP